MEDSFMNALYELHNAFFFNYKLYKNNYEKHLNWQ